MAGRGTLHAWKDERVRARDPGLTWMAECVRYVERLIPLVPSPHRQQARVAKSMAQCCLDWATRLDRAYRRHTEILRAQRDDARRQALEGPGDDVELAQFGRIVLLLSANTVLRQMNGPENKASTPRSSMRMAAQILHAAVQTGLLDKNEAGSLTCAAEAVLRRWNQQD